MAYIESLRALVGSRPLIVVGAAALVLDEECRVLLLKRSDGAGWGPPGGMMELGETTEQTVRRETYEETGIRLGDLELLSVFSGPEMFHRYPDGNQVYNVAVAYIVREWNGAISPDGVENSEARFFRLDRLPQVPKCVSPMLRRLAERLSGCNSGRT